MQGTGAASRVRDVGGGREEAAMPSPAAAGADAGHPDDRFDVIVVGAGHAGCEAA